MTFLNNYIDQIDTDLDRKKLKDFTKELYVEQTNDKNNTRFYRPLFDYLKL